MTVLNPPHAGAYLIGEEEARAVAEIVRSGRLFRWVSADGSSCCGRTEAWIGDWLGRPVHLVNSGTAGLRAALIGAGVEPGDIVLVSAFTFIATASAVLATGARPEPLDIGPYLEIDLDDLRAKLPRAKAVIGVYAPGHPSNMAEASAIVREAGVHLIEDACQAFGVSSHGARAGAIGDFGVFSFQQSKQLCAGEGGAVTAATESGLAAVKRFSDHGADRSADNLPSWAESDGSYGDNLHMTELHAAVLEVQTKRLEMMVTRQRALHAALADAANGCARLADSLDPDGHAGNHLLLLAPSEYKAGQAIKAARAHGVRLQWVWRTAFCDTPLIRRRFPGAQMFAPCAQSLACRILTLPIPPLDADDGEALLAACERMFEEIAALWR